MRKTTIPILAILANSLVGAQTLADAARKARENRHPSSNTIVYTNENLGVKTSGQLDTEAKIEGDAKKPAEDTAKKDEPSADDKAKAAEALKDKITAEQNEIDMLKREIDVAEREYRMRASQYYADAGARLQNQQQWVADDATRRGEIDSKKQALAAAESKLSQLESEARAGGPAVR